MVWVRRGDPRYHLLESCPYLTDVPEPEGHEETVREEKEAEAKRHGLVRCHHCYGSAGRAV